MVHCSWFNIIKYICSVVCILCMDTETGYGLPSSGEKARLLSTACWFWNSIGWNLAAAVQALVCICDHYC